MTRALRIVPLLAALSAACQSGAATGASCTRDGDCASPLACRFGRCRPQCTAQRDCPLGQTCLYDAQRVGSCALTDDPDCSAAGNACPAPLECVGTRCVNLCADVLSCPAGSACAPIGAGRARCVRTDGVDAGLGDAAPADGGVDDAGTRSGAVQVAIGDAYSCARTGTGRLLCWGAANGITRSMTDPSCVVPADGGMNVGCPTPASIRVEDPPGTIRDASGVDFVDAAGNLGCFTTAGRAFCWGEGDFYPLGHPGSDGAIARQVLGIDATQHVVSVEVMRLSVLGMLDSGTDWIGWGDTMLGELGSATGSPATAVPVPNLPRMNLGARAADTNHACAVHSVAADGGLTTVLACWGENDHGQVTGDGTPSAPVTTPVDVPGTEGVYEIALGHFHTCALVGTPAASTLRCWGWYPTPADAENSPFGPVTTGPCTPGTNCALTTIPSGSAHWQHLGATRSGSDTCVLDDAASVWCWGGGYATAGSTPTQINGISQARSVVITWDHACAIDASDRVLCWGMNDVGQLGRLPLTGTASLVAQPIALP